MADTDKQAKDNKGTKRKNMKKTRPPFDGPFGPRGLPPGFRPRGPGDWGPRGPPPPGMFRPRGPPLGGFGPRGPPMDWRGPLPGEFGPLGFRPRGPMDGPFRLHGDGPRGPPGPMGDFGPRGLDMHGPRPDMFPGPRPFGMRPPDNGQFAEDDFGIAGFNPGGPRMLAPLAKKKLKKSKKTKKTGSVADAKFATQKAKEPGKNKKDEKKDGQESEVDEDKLLATDDSSSSTSSDSESDDNEQQGKDAGNPRLPMQSPGGPPRPRFDQRPPHHQQRFHGRFEGPLPRHGQMEHRHRRPPPPLRQPLQQDGPPRMIQHNQHHPEHLPGQIQGQPQVIHLPPQGPDQPAVRMQLQPGQVLVRQIVPGLAQPVFRILQSGQLLQGQIPGQLPAQLQGQQIIQNLPAGHVFQQQPGGQPALVQLQQQQHNSARTGVSVSAAQMHLQSGINPDEARLPKQVAPNIVQLPNANNHVQHAQLPGQVRPSIVSSTAGAPLSTQPGQLRSAAPQGLQGNPGQPIFIPNSMGHPVQAGQNLNATLQASQQLILQQQQQLAAVQQQQLAFQQQHQQQIMQQQPQEMSQLQQQQQQQHRHDGRSQGRDHRRRRDDYSRGRRYNRTRSRSISRSRSRSWSGSDSQSRSRSSMSRSPSRSMSGSGSRSRSWSSGEDSRSPSPQRKKSGGRAAAERFDQNFRSNERYARQSSSSQHRQREFPPRQPPFPNKDEQRYEELERQRLRERERRDRERETGGTREQRPEKEYVPSKRRREEREPIEHREQANDSGRISESRQRREDRKDSKSSRDHNVSKEQRTASSTDVGNRVLISSLPPSMSERKLKQLMQSVGEVENKGFSPDVVHCRLISLLSNIEKLLEKNI